jgi:hypothetical protein
LPNILYWHGLQILSINNDSYLIIFILYQAWNPRQHGGLYLPIFHLGLQTCICSSS